MMCMIFDQMNYRQPAPLLRDLFLEVLTVHGNELRLFLSKMHYPFLNFFVVEYITGSFILTNYIGMMQVWGN